MYICPSAGEHHGSYQIFARMDDTTPDVAQDGITAELVLSGATGLYSGSLTVTVDGTDTVYDFATDSSGDASPGWFSVIVSVDTIKCYWNGVLLLTQAIASQTGLRLGYGMECTNAGGVCMINAFRVQYCNDFDVPVTRSLLVASAGGDLYRESEAGWLEKVTSDATLRDDVCLQAVQLGQKLYIADYGLRIKGEGTGEVADTVLTASGVSDWTAYEIDPDADVVVISDTTGTAVEETYRIASVAEAGVTLTESVGTGDCSFRVERALKVYDPIANTLTILDAIEGQVPTACPLIERFSNRIVLGGADYAPHVWYMSRQNDATDWDYAATDGDAQIAVAGVSSDTGNPGEAITALIPHSDDYLLLGCENSFWIMRGDPAAGGSLDNLSNTVGTVSANAWALGPSGEVIFLTRDGVYMMAAGGNSYPVPISRDALPQELMNIEGSRTVLMEFDVQDRGVHIYLTADSYDGSKHWWMDWSRKSFWPMSLDEDHEPTALCRVSSSLSGKSSVIIGGRDGWLRQYCDFADSDCGTSFSSYVMYGPIALGDGYQDGKIMELNAVLADDSGSVTWEVYTGQTFEAATAGTAVNSGTWTEGINYTDRPDAARGMAFVLKVIGTGLRWAMEGITGVTRKTGRQRLL